MSRLRTIEKLVADKMRLRPEFRSAKSAMREKLWLILRSENPDIKISLSSVERTQRKLWEQGLYMPETPQALEEWLHDRRLRQVDFVQYARGF